MNLIFSDKAWEEYIYWQNTDKQILKKINQLTIVSCKFHY